jgi:hypothetical protein
LLRSPSPASNALKVGSRCGSIFVKESVSAWGKRDLGNWAYGVVESGKLKKPFNKIQKAEILLEKVMREKARSIWMQVNAIRYAR